jgi:hypothetical protein
VTPHFHQATTLTPQQYIAGLTDFGPGRSKFLGNSADEYLRVHERKRFRPTSASWRRIWPSKGRRNRLAAARNQKILTFLATPNTLLKLDTSC